MHRQTYNIRLTLVGNKHVDHSDLFGTSPVGAAPTKSSFWLNTWLQRITERQLQDERRIIYVLRFVVAYIWDATVYVNFSGQS